MPVQEVLGNIADCDLSMVKEVDEKEISSYLAGHSDLRGILKSNRTFRAVLITENNGDRCFGDACLSSKSIDQSRLMHNLLSYAPLVDQIHQIICSDLPAQSVS